MSLPSVPKVAVPLLRYRREPRPLHFPVEAFMPESKRHMKLRTLLFEFLEFALSAHASVGSEQFVYWNASNPKRCLAPDVFIKLEKPDTAFAIWKTWEFGIPELAVEIVSDSDSSAEAWEAKLVRYHELGVRELVRFDADGAEGARVRVWDRVAEDLVEREVESDSTPCPTLGLWWVVRPGAGFPVALRLAKDAQGAELLLTVAEAAERRIAELEREREGHSR